MNKQNGTLILDQIQVNQKIKRMAYEIYENNFKEKRLFLAGIEGGGYMLSKMLKNQLDKISPIETQLLKIKLDKSAPSLSEINIDGELGKVKNHVVIMVDDVQNACGTSPGKLPVSIVMDMKFSTIRRKDQVLESHW